ncbi:MAG: deoxyribodipyrimidine photo-lyase, partial [bacterium]
MRTDLVREERVRAMNKGTARGKIILYWMSRDQRVEDNWALLYAAEQASQRKLSLVVVFTLAESFGEATTRQYLFMLENLKIVEKSLARNNIPFHVLMGKPPEEILAYTRENEVAMVITDFDPLKIKKEWKTRLVKDSSIPILEVDAHNIVPCWHASNKQEFAAYTFRPKITRQLEKFLEEFPALPRLKYQHKVTLAKNNWETIFSFPAIKNEGNRNIEPGPGPEEAMKKLDDFIHHKIKHYGENIHDPTREVSSGLSPYLHFGHVSAQRVALEIVKNVQGKSLTKPFLEQLIVRRELSDNYCYYNSNYDNTEGFPEWAKQTHEIHREDEREYLYSLEEFDNGKTLDNLWNAAQVQMVKTGKMHNYMRMYWAKKILEWTKTPGDALSIAIILNDRYSLDGRDPNGHAGIMWSIGGVHDRPWQERPVFGKIRYMNYNGAKRKFN